MLKTVDFSNQHFFKNEEVKLEHAGHMGSMSPKLFEMYQRFIKQSLKGMRALVSAELNGSIDEVKTIESIHKRIQTMIASAPDTEFMALDPIELEGKFNQVIHVLTNQSASIDTILAEFKYFVGTEELWSGAYESNVVERAGKRLYERRVSEMKMIFAQWESFKERIEKLKESIRAEGQILLKISLSKNIATWKVEVADAFNGSQSMIKLVELKTVSDRMVALSKESTVPTFHGTVLNETLFPLSENRHPSGFYICTGKAKYALKVKNDHSIDGTPVIVYQMDIPSSMLSLFKFDIQSGREGDDLSEEAYDNAYFLPVSRYPLFNECFASGIIKIKRVY